MTDQLSYRVKVRPKRHSLGDLVARYIKEVLPIKPKKASNSEQHLVWWQSKLGTYALSDVPPALIAKCRNELLANPNSIALKYAPIEPNFGAV